MLNYRKFKTSLIHLTLFLSTSLALTLPRKVDAQVVINGRLIQGQELAALEYQARTKLPPGNYHIDQNAGLMVYDGPSGQAIINLYNGQFVSHGANGLQFGNINQISGTNNNISSGRYNSPTIGNPYPQLGAYPGPMTDNQMQQHIEQDWQQYTDRQHDIQRDFQDYNTIQQDIDYYNIQDSYSTPDFNYSPDY